MNKEYTIAAKDEEPSIRITRAKAKVLGTLGRISPSSRPSFKQNQKQLIRENAKRAASEENRKRNATRVQHKRRAVLKDVTNRCEKSYKNCLGASKVQEGRGGPKRINSEVATETSKEVSSMPEDAKIKLAEGLSRIKMMEPKETSLPHKLREKESIQPKTYMICENLGTSDSLGIVDIDLDMKDSQTWSLYAPDIYNSIRVTELERRPPIDYMEKVQQDITPTMRGILIDWLVEVSEEYKLVPDTLYLTVNLIDRFLSQNLIEKQRLQLLGVTCMLIASKYEEISAPRVEEFCFITDNTYTRADVLKMEREVLNFLYFQLSVPTTKTFLRRFIQAAQSSNKITCVELAFLANYLAELTLTDYSFLQFLPSIIAASAVFLAKWILNQSDHPWNPTLEHYTKYKAVELKSAVLALEDLQINTKECALNAIHEKYKQEKFKCVASLTSQKPVVSLF